MDIGYIGLGKMGLAQVGRLLEKGHRVVAWNRSAEPRREARRAGAEPVETLPDLARSLEYPRLIWLMVPHGAVDEVLGALVLHLERGDTVIDGGNSFYRDSQRRAARLARRGIHFLDVGVSGGPEGARRGACLMAGGDKEVFKKHEKLFSDLSAPLPPPITRPHKEHTYKLKNIRMLSDGKSRGSYAYVGRSGAGHFVKMVHNGIEYGMMQSLAEGFALLRAAEQRGLDTGGRGKKRFGLNLSDIAKLYDKGSVIESRLVGWLAKAYKEHGEGLTDISSEVAQSGEGLWTVKTAKELGVPVNIIEDALKFRLRSKGNPSYIGQILSALRSQFGGHEVSAKLKVKN